VPIKLELPPGTEAEHRNGHAAPQSMPPDRIGQRLRVAFVVSLIINAILWSEASRFVRNHIVPPPVMMQVTLLPPPVKHIVKVKPKVKPKPKPPPPKKKPVTPPPKPVAKTPPPKHAPPPPPAPHHHVITAPSKGPAPPNAFTAQPGGNAPVGKPTNGEGTGNGTTPPPPTPAPAPAPAPPPPAPAPAPPPPAPKPAPPPEPTGPTQDATATHQELPEIPDELKSDDLQTSVRVRVEIAADGSFTPFLRSSSGNAEIDQRVLDALKKWTWKPALKNGVPVASTQYFRFDFEVE
jgi:TonB family protein